jgi:parallel beta-helix repeat protein
VSGGVVPGFRGADVAQKPVRVRNIAILAWLMVLSLTVALVEPRVVGSSSENVFDGVAAFVTSLSSSFDRTTTGSTTSVDALKEPTIAASDIGPAPAASARTSVATSFAPAAAPKVAPATSAALTLSMASGRTGTELTISGLRFPVGQPLFITWDGAVLGSQPITPDAGGTFQKKIVIPATTPGPHTLGANVVSGPVGGKQVVLQVASAVFIVAAAAAATNPAITPSSPLPTTPVAGAPLPTTAPARTAAPAPTTGPAPTTAPAPTTVPAPTATAAPASPLPAAGGLDVRTFGALGDGQTDDTAAIHRARDAAGASGALQFPAGTYMVANLRLTASGQVWNLAPTATLKLKASANTDLIVMSGAGARLVGGRLDGNRSAQVSSGTCVVMVGGGGVIQGTEILNCRGWGVYVYGADATKISGSVIHDISDAAIYVENGADDTTIDGNVVQRTTGAGAGGIVVHGMQNTAGVGSRTRITNNRVESVAQISIESWSPASLIQGNTTIGGTMGISVGAADGTRILGNVVSGATDYGIEIGNTASVTVSGNTVSSVTGDAGIIVDDSAHGNMITSNQLRSVVRGVQVSLGSTANTISGNTFETWSLYGIEAHQVDGSIIGTNTFTGAGTQINLI